MIDAKEFAKAGQKYLGTPYSTMDCQAFVEACMRDCGLKKDLKGSNAWFRQMDWVGTPEECKKIYGSIPTGAMLFIWSDDGGEVARGYKDGKGNASHIGIVTHTGKGAIHSSSSRGEVAESRFKDKTIANGGWNRIGLSRLFDYGDKINQALSGSENQDEVKIEMEYATVYTENGCSVKLRPSKSTRKPWLTQIPTGAQLLISEKDGTWAKTTFDGYEGYVMQCFLRFDDIAGAISISLERGHAEALLAALKKALGGESNV